MRRDQISYNPPRARDALSDPVTSFGNLNECVVTTHSRNPESRTKHGQVTEATRLRDDAGYHT